MNKLKYAVLVLCITSATPAFAGKLLFGDRETIHKIQDISYQGSSGERYYLGYKTTMKMIFAGVYLSDDGYVLGINGSHEKYIPLDAEKISSLQSAGLLPDPMPGYTVGLLDYAFGYSLWILIIVSGLYYWIKSLFRKREVVA